MIFIRKTALFSLYAIKMHGVAIFSRPVHFYFWFFLSLFFRSIDYRFRQQEIMLSESEGCYFSGNNGYTVLSPDIGIFFTDNTAESIHNVVNDCLIVELDFIEKDFVIYKHIGSVTAGF